MCPGLSVKKFVLFHSVSLVHMSRRIIILVMFANMFLRSSFPLPSPVLNLLLFYFNSLARFLDFFAFKAPLLAFVFEKAAISIWIASKYYTRLLILCKYVMRPLVQRFCCHVSDIVRTSTCFGSSSLRYVTCIAGLVRCFGNRASFEIIKASLAKLLNRNSFC